MRQLERRPMYKVMGFEAVPGWDRHTGRGDILEGAGEPARPWLPKRRFGG
jgi:hypothetical protein